MTAKLECVHIYSREEPNQPAGQGGSQWHSSRIIVETGPSDREWHAHAPRKNRGKRRRRLRSAKPSARPPKPRRMRSKRPSSLEGYRFRETPPFPVQRLSLQSSGASMTCMRAQGRKLVDGKPSIAMPFDAV